MWLTNSPINYLDRTLKLASSFDNVEGEISKHSLHEINIVKAVSEIRHWINIIDYVLENGEEMFPYPQGLVQLLVMSLTGSRRLSWTNIPGIIWCSAKEH